MTRRQQLLKGYQQGRIDSACDTTRSIMDSYAAASQTVRATESVRARELQDRKARGLLYSGFFVLAVVLLLAAAAAGIFG